MTTITVELTNGDKRRMTGELYVSLADGCLAVMRDPYPDLIVMAFAPDAWVSVEREDEHG